jgi:hypothetical protein
MKRTQRKAMTAKPASALITNQFKEKKLPIHLVSKHASTFPPWISHDAKLTGKFLKGKLIQRR